MNNAELVWRLVELLLQKEKHLNQLAIEKVQKVNNSNAKKQNEA